MRPDRTTKITKTSPSSSSSSNILFEEIILSISRHLEKLGSRHSFVGRMKVKRLADLEVVDYLNANFPLVARTKLVVKKKALRIYTHPSFPSTISPYLSPSSRDNTNPHLVIIILRALDRECLRRTHPSYSPFSQGGLYRLVESSDRFPASPHPYPQ